jgi:predicted enzyme related to lactoylglutathione lyase
MAMSMPMSRAIDATPAFLDGRPRLTRPVVPRTRIVRSLEEALRGVRELGGTIASETRTAPGIGSWAFVADVDGTEIVLWQDAATV